MYIVTTLASQQETYIKVRTMYLLLPGTDSLVVTAISGASEL